MAPHIRSAAFFAALSLVLGCTPAYALAVVVSSLHGRALACQPCSKYNSRAIASSSSTVLHMRDSSAAYWFSVGDSVQVVEDVFKAERNLRGWRGRVVQTWEKCDVDPTCCCAEQVDTGMAVRVAFEPQGEHNEEPFFHYFAESELIKSS
jgi:hypothetical protein